MQQAAGRVEQLGPLPVVHEDHPAEGAEQADQVVRAQGHLPGDRGLLDLVEGEAGRDLEPLAPEPGLVDRTRHLLAQQVVARGQHLLCLRHER